MSFDRDVALARAEELARLARDRRRDWGGPDGEPLAIAAQARAVIAGDVRGALRLLLSPALPPGGASRGGIAARGPARGVSWLSARGTSGWPWSSPP